MTGKFIDNAKRLKSDIDFTNRILTGLDYEDTRVKLAHETVVYKKYIMDWCENGHGYRTIIEFNGYVGKITENGFVRMFDATGYMKWKLGCVRRALDKKIKSQDLAREKAAKKQVRAQNRAKKFQKMRDALANFLFDQEKEK